MKIRIIGLYQVIMHYRLPFYEKIGQDPDYDFTLFHGKGKAGTKLVNTNIDEVKFKHEQLNDYRIPLPFTPTLFFKLIKNNPQIVFSEGSSSLINGSIAFIYAKIFNKKFIWWSLGTLKYKKRGKIRRLISLWENYIEKKSDAIFSYSTQGYDYFISRKVASEKIFVAVNVFDTTKKLKEIESSYVPNFLPAESFNIGFIGTIQKTKNLELLVDVVFELNKKYGSDKFLLHIIGDGEHLKDLKEYCNGNSSIKLYGRMNSGSSKILKNCDLMVLPGLGGLAIVEGMLNSLPIITGCADGTEYDLIDDTNGAILDPINFQNLMTQVELYYENRDNLIKLGENSLYKITNQYSFENYYNTFKNMISYIQNK